MAAPCGKRADALGAVVKLRFLLLLIMISWGLTGCVSWLNRGDEAAEPAAITDQGALVCTAECAARAQCGQDASGANVVFASSIGPVVEGHDLLFPTGGVTILNAAPQTVETIATGERFSLTFYQVATGDGRIGWTAGWCVQPPQ